VNFNY